MEPNVDALSINYLYLNYAIIKCSISIYYVFDHYNFRGV